MKLDKFKLLYETIQTEPFELTNAGLADTLAGIKYDLDISNDVENDSLLDDVEGDSVYEDELDEPIGYTEEMVNVMELPSKGKMYCCIEADSLAKFMQANDLEIGNIGDAIARVAAVNGVEINNIALVMESNATIKALIKEAKAEKGGKALSLLGTFANLAKNAKNKGIKVLKKCSGKK